MNEDVKLYPESFKDSSVEDILEYTDYCVKSTKKLIEITGNNEEEYANRVMTECKHLSGFEWEVCFVDIERDMGMDVDDYQYEDYMDE